MSMVSHDLGYADILQEYPRISGFLRSSGLAEPPFDNYLSAFHSSVVVHLVEFQNRYNELTSLEKLLVMKGVGLLDDPSYDDSSFLSQGKVIFGIYFGVTGMLEEISKEALQTFLSFYEAFRGLHGAMFS